MILLRPDCDYGGSNNRYLQLVAVSHSYSALLIARSNEIIKLSCQRLVFYGSIDSDILCLSNLPIWWYVSSNPRFQAYNFHGPDDEVVMDRCAQAICESPSVGSLICVGKGIRFWEY